MQTFGSWAPDALGIISDPQTQKNVAGEAKGVLPDITGYCPWPAPAITSPSLNASTAVANNGRGAIAALTTANAIAIFAGTATKLWKFADVSSPWTDVSRSSGGNYALVADDIWQFIQFGDNLVALDRADVPQYIGITSGTNFAPLPGSPPSARFGAVCGSQLLLANTSNSALEVYWSGRNDISYWTKGQRDCDAETMPDGGDIQGITGIEQGGLIIQTQTVRQYFARTDRAIFEFHRVEQAQGTRSPYSIIPYQGGAFYYGSRGFVAVGLDGTAQPIGVGLVDQWFRANSNIKTRPKALIGALDPVRARMFWLFSSGSPTSNVYDSILCFDPATVGSEYGPWTHADIPATFIFSAASTSTTLEGLGSGGLGYTAESVPYSLDSDIWKGGAPALAMFDSSNRLNLFSGSSLAAIVDTALFAPIPGRRSFVRGFRPVTDLSETTGAIGTDITGRIYHSERAEDTPVADTVAYLNAQGLFETRSSGRFLRAEVAIAAGASWSHLVGIDDVDIIEDGER